MIKSRITQIFAGGVVLVSALRPALAADKTYEPNWASLDQRPTPAWYQDAKFGVFIHWGLYSVPAWGMHGEYAEWYWNRLDGNNPKWAEWRDFHAKNYGTNFDYKDFAPRFTAELFDADEVDTDAAATGLGPSWAELREPWLAELQLLLDEATLALPAATRFRSTAKRGVHSEHMGYLLAEMQYLQRAYPGGVW